MDWLALRDYGRNLLAKIANSGWRPIFGWGGVPFFYTLLKFSYIEAIRDNLALPDGYYLGVNALFALYLGAFIARGVEKAVERHQNNTPIGGNRMPEGGIVNNGALNVAPA